MSPATQPAWGRAHSVPTEKVTSHLESGAVPGCGNSQAKFLLCLGAAFGMAAAWGRGWGEAS